MSITPISPRVFVGSSSEAKRFAVYLERFLRSRGCDAIGWWQPGVFPPGKSFLDSVEDAARRFDAALLVATPDDFTTSRYPRWMANGNVILEYGIFLASQGRHRVALATIGDVDLPSDLKGINQIPVRIANAPLSSSKSLTMAADTEERLTFWSDRLRSQPPTEQWMFHWLDEQESFEYLRSQFADAQASIEHAAFIPKLNDYATKGRGYMESIARILRENRIHYRYLAGLGDTTHRLDGIERIFRDFDIVEIDDGRRYRPKAVFQIDRHTNFSIHVFDARCVHVFLPGAEGAPGRGLFSTSPPVVRGYLEFFDAIWSEGILVRNLTVLHELHVLHGGCRNRLLKGKYAITQNLVERV